MGPLRLLALVFALGTCVVTCGEPFEGSPLFSPSDGARAGDASGGSGASAGTSSGAGGGAASSTSGGAATSGASGNGNGGGGTAQSQAGAPSTGMAGDTSAGLGGGGGEGGSPAPPVAMEGLVLWLHAAHGVQHENGIVQGWADQSGNANDALQTAENVMPKLDAGALDGLPALVFDEDDFLRLPAGFSDFSQGLTVFAVAELDQDVCVGLLTLSNGAEVDDISVGRYNGAFLYEVADDWTEEAPLALGMPALLAVVHRPSEAIELRINQLLGAEPSWPLPAVVERLENVVGRSGYAGCGALQGKLSELLVYDRAVSDAELLEIEGYLQQEWSCCE